MFDHACGSRDGETAAGGQNEFVVAAHLFGTRCTDVAHAFLHNVDGFCSALDELHADRIKQLTNRCSQLVRIRLIEARTHAQLGLRGQNGHFNVVVTMNVEQTRSAQSCPHATETCADYQDVLFHF